MENNTSSRLDDLFSTASQYIKGSFPNPEDNGKPRIHLHWPGDPILHEAYKDALLTIIAARLPEIWDIINQGGVITRVFEPQPNPWFADRLLSGSFKLTVARSFAQVAVSKAQTMQYTGENAGRNKDYIGGIQFVSDVTDDICPPYQHPHIPHHHFDGIDLFVIAQEFRLAAASIEHEGLKQSLTQNAGKLTEAALKQAGA